MSRRGLISGNTADISDVKMTFIYCYPKTFARSLKKIKKSFIKLCFCNESFVTKDDNKLKKDNFTQYAVAVTCKTNVQCKYP